MSKPFVAVTAATGAFFVYVGMLVPLLPRFIEDELDAGELGVGLSLSTFAFAAIFARPVIGRLVMRYGRRRVMIGGSLLAGVAGFLCATVDSLPSLLAFRGLAGIGEAALFVGAATLVADLAPPHRRAEAASYFSVAVFGGLGVGPIIGEAVLGDDRFHLAFLVAAAFTVLAAVLSLAVPHSVEPAADGPELEPRGTRSARAAPLHPSCGRRARARPGVRHRRLLGVLGLPSRPRPLDRLRRLGRSVRRLQRGLPRAAHRRRPRARAPRCPALRDDRVRLAGRRPRGSRCVPRGVGAVDARPSSSASAWRSCTPR